MKASLMASRQMGLMKEKGGRNQIIGWKFLITINQTRNFRAVAAAAGCKRWNLPTNVLHSTADVCTPQPARVPPGAVEAATGA
jgi:hypothetical protein